MSSNNSHHGGKSRPKGTSNGGPRNSSNEGQPRGGNFTGNIRKVQETPWSEAVRLDNQTVKQPLHPAGGDRNRSIV